MQNTQGTGMNNEEQVKEDQYNKNQDNAAGVTGTKGGSASSDKEFEEMNPEKQSDISAKDEDD